jgi:hypothetical protein
VAAAASGDPGKLWQVRAPSGREFQGSIRDREHGARPAPEKSPAGPRTCRRCSRLAGAHGVCSIANEPHARATSGDHVHAHGGSRTPGRKARGWEATRSAVLRPQSIRHDLGAQTGDRGCLVCGESWWASGPPPAPAGPEPRTAPGLTSSRAGRSEATGGAVTAPASSETRASPENRASHDRGKAPGPVPLQIHRAVLPVRPQMQAGRVLRRR